MVSAGTFGESIPETYCWKPPIGVLTADTMYTGGIDAIFIFIASLLCSDLFPECSLKFMGKKFQFGNVDRHL